MRPAEGIAELRARVEALFAADEQNSDFMEGDPGGDLLKDGGAGLGAESPGEEIGNYKLLQQIGEGGFGVVYMAEQLRPVKRRVALKIIKLGMDTRQVVARFEAERQALALMDHPNIAKVLRRRVDRDRAPLLRDGAGARDPDHATTATRTT